MYNVIRNLNHSHIADQLLSRESKDQRPADSILYHQIQGPLSIETPVRADYLNIVLFEKGQGNMQVDGEVYPIEKRKVIVVFPGQVSSFNWQEDTITHLIIAKKEIYEAMTSIGRLPVGKSKPVSSFDLEGSTFRILLHEFKEIEKLLENQQEESEDIIINRFRTIYLILKASCMKLRVYNFSKIQHPAIDGFIQLVERSYKTQRSVAFYAHELNITPNYLTILCTSLIETSPKRVIQNRLLQEAKQLILGTGLSIKEIAYDLGFADISHFSAFFKKETGFSPRAFLRLRCKGFKG